MLSIKDLVFKERPVKRLMERYIESYEIKEVVSKNAVRLRLLNSMRIHPVVNVSRVVKYREPAKGQKVEEAKPVEIKRVSTVKGIYSRV